MWKQNCQKEYLSSQQNVTERKPLLSQMSKIHTEDQGRTEVLQIKTASQRRFHKKFYKHWVYANIPKFLRSPQNMCKLSMVVSLSLMLHFQERLTSTKSWGITQTNNFGKRFERLNTFFADSESIRGKQHVFNIALTELIQAVMADKLRLVFANLDNSAKLNFSLSVALHKSESDYNR